MQAARGTAISPDTPDRRVWGRRRAVATMLGAGGALIVVDQVTKALAVAFLTERQQVPVLGPLLSLFLIRNPGAAFSLGTSTTWIFSLLAIVATLLLLFVAVPRVRVRGWCAAVALFIAGVGGNLIDRLVRPPGVLRGHVVDFLQLPHWPIFNVADICITCGAALLVALSSFGALNYDGSAREDAARRSRDDAEPDTAGATASDDPAERAV